MSGRGLGGVVMAYEAAFFDIMGSSPIDVGTSRGEAWVERGRWVLYRISKGGLWRRGRDRQISTDVRPF